MHFCANLSLEISLQCKKEKPKPITCIQGTSTLALESRQKPPAWNFIFSGFELHSKYYHATASVFRSSRLASKAAGWSGGVCCLLFRWVALDCGTRSVPRDAVSRNCDWLAILADLNNSRWPGGFFVDINKPSHLFPAIRRRRKLALVLIA